MSELIDYIELESKITYLNKEWHSKTPFKYIVFENFFEKSAAETIYQNYPPVEGSKWDYTTYLNQRNKFVMTKFENPVIQEVFNELNSPRLLNLLEKITSIDELQSDPKLFGGGLHQSTHGAFLDVHVDFNIHPETKFHRRMNLIVFMNKNWKENYNGYLELWDMNKKEQIEYIKPEFNRCVIFETNEVSYHGHPKPLQTPESVSRKSVAVYYYTKERDPAEIVDDHNTIYVNTEGHKGMIKNIKSGIKAFFERIIHS